MLKNDYFQITDIRKLKKRQKVAESEHEVVLKMKTEIAYNETRVQVHADFFVLCNPFMRLRKETCLQK